MSISDQAIIEAAKEAGLCFHECWDLEYTPEDLSQDEEWINSDNESLGPKETRIAIWEASEKARQEKLAKLRLFIELATKKKVTHWTPSIVNCSSKLDMW